MKAIRYLLALFFLVAGLLVGAHLEQGRAFAGESARAGLLSVYTDALLVRASETFSSRTASADNKPTEAFNLSNIVEILKPQATDDQLAAVSAAARLPLMTEDEQIFLPLLWR